MSQTIQHGDLGTANRLDRSLAMTDALSPELRACVHEFGLPIVRACIDAGVKTPNKIRHLVHEIWEGARCSRQHRSPADKLDWLLIQAGAQISSAQLAEVFKREHLLIIPSMPTAPMIEASLAEVSNHGLICTKREKHRLRLVAALRAEPNYLARLRKQTP
jgi:hypothetical protein